MTRRRPIALAAVSRRDARARGLRPGARSPRCASTARRYTAEQPLAFTGAGYTPSGPVVQLVFSVPGEPRAAFTGAADPAGGISGQLGARTTLLKQDEDRRELCRHSRTTRRGRRRARSRRSPSSAAAQLTFTRWEGFSPGRFVPGRMVEVEAYGWAFAAGKHALLPLPEGPHDRRLGARSAS